MGAQGTHPTGLVIGRPYRVFVLRRTNHSAGTVADWESWTGRGLPRLTSDDTEGNSLRKTLIVVEIYSARGMEVERPVSSGCALHWEIEWWWMVFAGISPTIPSSRKNLMDALETERVSLLQASAARRDRLSELQRRRRGLSLLRMRAEQMQPVKKKP